MKWNLQVIYVKQHKDSRIMYACDYTTLCYLKNTWEVVRENYSYTIKSDELVANFKEIFDILIYFDLIYIATKRLLFFGAIKPKTYLLIFQCCQCCM